MIGSPHVSNVVSATGWRSLDLGTERGVQAHGEARPTGVRGREYDLRRRFGEGGFGVCQPCERDAQVTRFLQAVILFCVFDAVDLNARYPDCLLSKQAGGRSVGQRPELFVSRYVIRRRTAANTTPRPAGPKVARCKHNEWGIKLCPLVEDQTWGWLNRPFWWAGYRLSSSKAKCTVGDWAIRNQGGERFMRVLPAGGSPLDVPEARG
ncbi:uncharacterized protein B0T15DRAFT_79769 [Chaetomium strumarium]|uniref:Uncharacterized protein n=1 Tax=Chaetomium strumarium TaxID=1170767 RepID=A0AAJ0H4A1_9PEZI|nr:hypothetical protein B0T15DRAFT_79769 [Chaetomium strumarium]